MDVTKIEFHSGMAIGDILMMTSAIRDFKTAYPDRYLIRVVTTAQHLWDYNPYLTEFDEPDMVVKIGPRKFVNGSQTRGLHYVNAFRESMETNLNIPIPQGHIKPDLHLSAAEKDDRIIEGKYWIIIAGGKADFTTKIWPIECWQEVVSAFPDITFVQLGEEKHNHPALEGDNVINMIGETEDPDTGIRDLIKLFYHCEGSLGLVSMQMHMAAAFNKACVVVAGAREPTSFERYNIHQYITNQGALRCKNDCENCKSYSKEGKKVICKDYKDDELFNYYKDKKLCRSYNAIDTAKIPVKACWKSKLEDCTNQVEAYGGNYPKCLIMIKPDDVIRAIDSYYEGGALRATKEKARVKNLPLPSLQPFPAPDGKPIFKMVCNAHAYIGGERSCAWIMNKMREAGYHVQLVPKTTVCREFRDNIPDVEITGAITDPCDIIMIYANDMIWEFNKERYEIMDRVKADKKIMMLNFKLGAAGKAEWTKHWDLYGFLCSQMRDDFLKRVPNANCFVLPPAVDIEPFLNARVKYNQTLHLVRHSSQGERKYPEDMHEMLQDIREVYPSVIFSFMPAPGTVNNIPKVYKFAVNEIPVIDFLQRGSCFWYRLPDGYSDQGPRTIVEAMAVGLPVIADNRWGAKDRVTEETGWLCDTKDDYIEVIKTLDHKILSQKGVAAKERARQEFDPYNWIKTITS
jgi:ADP-heptose:LPS heptosyltransferase